MTVRFYVHSVAKRAEAVALLDSGATENFMNLSYAKWLKLPIKQLAQPRALFNVDGTENKSGKLQYYTDLHVRTGGNNTTMRFFLSDLGEHKAILGYPWFAAAQPKIDWKRGWIDHTQLPIVIKAPNAQKAVFVPRTRNIPRPVKQKDRIYVIRSIQPGNDADLSRVPKQFHRHWKVFSEESSQRLPQHT